MQKKGTARAALAAALAGALALSAGAFAPAASAAPAVSDGFSISGIVDLGVQVQHTGGATSTTMESGNNQSSSIDLHMRESINDDLYVHAYLSTWFLADDGELCESGRLFDESSLTLGSRRFGEVLLGRIGSMKSPDGEQSVFARAEGFSPMGSNLPHTGLAWVFTTGGVLNNAVGWSSPVLNGHQVLMQYADGVVEDGTGHDEDRQGSLAWVYNGGGDLRGGVILTYRGHGSDATRHKATMDVMASANYDFEAFRLYVTYQHVKDGAGTGTILRRARFSGLLDSERGFDTDALMVGVATQLAGGRLSAVIQGSHSEYKGDAAPGAKTTGWRLNPAAIWRRPLSSRTTVWTAGSWSHGWGMYRQVANDASRPDNPNCWTWGAGLTHTF